MKNDDKTKPLDEFEVKMISLLSTNARMAVTELAEKVGLSKSPCQARMKRLERDGYILGYRTVLSAKKLRKEHVCFAEVKLTDTGEKSLSEFNAAVLLIPEIEQCHLIAGACDYLLKIRTEDIQAYRYVLAESISKLPHIASTSTLVSMQSIKDNAF